MHLVLLTEVVAELSRWLVRWWLSLSPLADRSNLTILFIWLVWKELVHRKEEWEESHCSKGKGSLWQCQIPSVDFLCKQTFSWVRRIELLQKVLQDEVNTKICVPCPKDTFCSVG